MAIRSFASVSGSIRECEAIPQDKEALRQTLRSHLKDIFPHLNIIVHDYLAGVANFNTLAYDTNRKKFVIVEYIRGENGLASRVIEYGDELKKKVHQNDILKLYLDKHGKNETFTNWPGAYVIAVSDHFSDRDKELAPKRKFSLPTELHTVTIHRTLIMEIESIDNVHVEKTDTVSSKPKTKSKSARPGRPAKGTMEFFLSGRDKKLRKLGLTLGEELVKMQLTLKILNSKQYAYFTLDSTRVCAIKVLRDKIRLIYSITESTPVLESDFVYRTKNSQLGGYASDIKTSTDIDKALQVVKRVCDMASKGSNSKQTDASKHNQKTITSDIKFEFRIDGQKFQEKSAIGAVKKIIEYLAGSDNQFLKRVEGMKHGRTRRYIAQNKSMLYPGKPDLYKYSVEISTAPGWYLGTNYNEMSLKKIAAVAKEAADTKIRDTMTGDIFELYTPKRAKSTTKDTKLVTDSGHTIPDSEDVTNEFKSSFVYNYKAAEFESSGNRKAAAKARDDVKRENFGFGLEWDVAKAIAGFSNSDLEEGRIWIGVKENKGSRPTILGLKHDFQKANAKNWDDDFRNWINNLIGKCIRDYNGFHNFELSFPEVSGKRICLLVVKKSREKPMILFTKQDPNITIYYRRNKIAPRTDRLRGEEWYNYRTERFHDQKS